MLERLGFPNPNTIKKGITLAATIGTGHLPDNGTYKFRVLSGPNGGASFSTREPEQGFALGKYEKEVSEAIDKILRPGDVFFDVGANVGWDTLIASKKVGQSGIVISFEPGESNLQLLRKNIANNKRRNVHIQPKGVGANTSQLLFAEYGYGLVNHVITPNTPAQPDAKITAIDIVSIDDFVAGEGIVPNLIKIDIEGHELDALKGAAHTLAEHRPIIICEVRNTNWGEIHDLVSGTGYDARFLGGGGRGLNTAGLDDVLLIPRAA